MHALTHIPPATLDPPPPPSNSVLQLPLLVMMVFEQRFANFCNLSGDVMVHNLLGSKGGSG